MYVTQNTLVILKDRLSQKDYQKIMRPEQPGTINQFITTSIEICNPENIFVGTDSAEDIQYTQGCSGTKP